MRRLLAVVAVTAAVLVTSPLPAANALSCVGYPTHAEFVAVSAKNADHLFTGRVVRRRNVRSPDTGMQRSWAYDVDVVEALKGDAKGRVTVLAPSDDDVKGIAGYGGHGLRLDDGKLTFFATYGGFKANVLCGTLTTQDDVAGRADEVRTALGLPPAGAPPAGASPAGPSGPAGDSSFPLAAVAAALAAVTATAVVLERARRARRTRPAPA